jgi:hypothetical protein
VIIISVQNSAGDIGISVQNSAGDIGNIFTNKRVDCVKPAYVSCLFMYDFI